MDNDKAYLFGLIIGGGIFGPDENALRIVLPYKKWGSYLANPQRAQEISKDIMEKVNGIFQATYGISVQYQASKGGTWTILCSGNLMPLKEDLTSYGVDCEGELRGVADIHQVVNALTDINLKRRFIAGLADTIGSMKPTHRRFDDDHQIVSFEIKGFNFSFVCCLCHLLYDVGCYPDQIEWNHPNIHSAQNPYYKRWKKGFKLRVLLDQYEQFGAFSFRSKAIAVKENQQLQTSQHSSVPCEEQEIKITPSCVHCCENALELPDSIRGGHYIHSRHFCAVLGCEHAPCTELEQKFSKVGEIIIPFSILCKDTEENIWNIINSDTLLKLRNYTEQEIKVAELLFLFCSRKGGESRLIYGDTQKDAGYSLSTILQAVAYVVADCDELNNTRVKGNYKALLQRHVQRNPTLSVTIYKPDLLTPLIVVGNNRGALVGPQNPKVYEKLISRDPENRMKLVVRKITEKDLRDGEAE